MNTNSFDAFNQKVSLIYEYNNKSPLFARVAENEIEKNNVDEAIKILTDGLNTYPDFSVAYFLLSKAHTIKGNYGQALKFVKKGSELIHSPKTFDYYLREIDAIKKQRQLFNVSRWAESSNENFSNFAPILSNKTEIKRPTESIEETLNKLTAEIDAVKKQRQLFNVSRWADSANEKFSNFTSTLANKTEKEKPAESIEETLNKLTSEIEGANQTVKEARKKIEETKQKDFSTNDFIVSETLAKIYITQGEFKEAISVYKKLKIKNPEKETYFDSKIAELKAKLSA